ncbi:MAG: mitochondrial carrier domain-containing protein [Olpidium bornovanus]|uniref:Mitochondrial carrier domain-containing protein n=1 Tax=Olpidium bornovanus TaxID=278681 RepID=A0A8H8DKY7_9FUNG|nr:MAG: mitochondrial carrier domain-containing protein [Olpidium bornovanus]
MENAAQIIEYEGLPQSESFSSHLIAGAIAGISEHAAMYPVDSIKTRMQVMSPSPQAVYSGIVHAVSRISSTEGSKTLWRGISSVITGAGPAHALHFATYEKCKDIFERRTETMVVAHGAVCVSKCRRYNYYLLAFVSAAPAGFFVFDCWSGHCFARMRRLLSGSTSGAALGCLKEHALAARYLFFIFVFTAFRQIPFVLSYAAANLLRGVALAIFLPFPYFIQSFDFFDPALAGACATVAADALMNPFDGKVEGYGLSVPI